MFGVSDRYVPKEKEGAGNNWGIGYSSTDKYSDDIIDIITREAEDCDSFEVCILFVFDCRDL